MDIDAIKEKAREIIRVYNPERLVPFPFESMVNRLDELELQFFETDKAISGVIFYQAAPDDSEQTSSAKKGTFTVVINSDKPEVRQYFTIAHEFGHYFVHRDWLIEHPGFVDLSDNMEGQSLLLRPNDPSLSPDPIKERQANTFAAELVMPEDKVREYWDLVGNVEECAKAFRVSIAAMAVRLERLNLI